MRSLILNWQNRLLITLMAFLIMLPALAEIAPAGVVISNRAEVSWFDTKDGTVKKLFSNVSTIQVAELHGLDLERDNLLTVPAGQPISLPHRLINTGNIASDYELQVKDVNSDAGSLLNLKLYTDSNGNGLADAGEQQIPSIACQNPQTDVTCFPIDTLQAGDLTEFVLTGMVVTTASINDVYQHVITVVSNQDTTKTDSNNDDVKVQQGAALALNKSVSPACGVPIKAKDTLQYSINFTNTGNAIPQSRVFNIDGTDVSGAVLEDTIPPNVHLEKINTPEFAPFQGQTLVQLKSDEDTNRWIGFDVWDGSATISKIGLYLPVDQMQPNQSGFLDFKVVADDRLTTSTIFNEAGFNTQGDLTPEFLSNQVCSTLVADTTSDPSGDNDAEIRFLTPIMSIKRAGDVPDFGTDSDFEDAPYYRMDNGFGDLGASGYDTSRDGVYIEVHSTGLNGDEDTAEIHMVTVTSATGDTLRVAVMETTPNSGVFRSIRPVRLSKDDAGNGADCPASGTSADYNVVEPNCVLQSVEDGSLRASINDPGVGEILVDSALIDPLGVVFDSAYNYPVAGATVTIHNADGTIAEDPLTGSPYPAQVTGVDGRYQFPFLYPQDGTHSGEYYLNVVPPANYTFPSATPAITLIGNTGRSVNQYSYGIDGHDGTTGSGIFTLLPTSADLVADLPLDPDLGDVLAISKSTTRAQASIGDFVTYSIKIHNRSDLRDNFDAANTFDPKLYAVKLYDKLPYGFRYVSGTAMLDGERIDDPVGAPGPNLTFSIFNNPTDFSLDNLEHTLTYKVRINAGAIDGDGVNSAVMDARTVNSLTLNSNTSSAKVRISQDGVLDARGIVFGKVYVDANCDNIQDGGEWPIGGVKLYMEDGTWVITDGNGQYSLYGINPGNHVIKVDPITLPEGLTLKPTDNRHMADPGSRLVDMVTGEFHRADFVASCPKEEAEYVFEQIQARNAGTNDFMLENAEKYDPNKEFVNNDLNRATGADGDLSNGTVGFTQYQKNAIRQISTGPQINRGYSYMIARYRSKAAAAQGLTALPPSVRPDAFIYQTGDFQTLRAGFSLHKHGLNDLAQKLQSLNIKASRVTTIYERLPAQVIERLESPAGSQTMATPQVAIKQVNKQQAKLGTWLWPQGDISMDGRFMVAVRAGLEPTLKVNGQSIPASQIGERIENKREKAQVVAWYGVELAPGVNQVEVVAKDPFGNQRVLAAGQFKRPDNAVKIVIEAADDELPADGGRSYLPVKVRLLDENGYPARGTHFVTLEASDGSWVERDIQDQNPGRQVRVVNGERTVHLRSSEYTGDVKLHIYDGDLKAEKRITQIAALRPLLAVGIIDMGVTSSSFDNRLNAPASQRDDSEFDARGAIFMKGRVRGDAHLTLSYDSDKDTDAERFRDINPNTGYPMFGDASQRGYDAQSRSKLYAKVEKGKNSVMWGDYLTDSYLHHESVARVQRSLTGANAIYDDGETRLQVYGARPEDNNITEEIRGQGTALNYRIDKNPIIRNSEVVEIVIYSRDNPGVVLSTRQLTRFGDYTLDDITGDLSFSDSIPYVDDDLNPVFIRVTYDVENNGDEYTVGGIRLNHQMTDELNVGISHSIDEHKTDGKSISGVSGEYKTDDIRITASAAALKHEDSSKQNGNAYRLGIEKSWDKDATTRFSYGRADAGFDNQSGGISADREEARVTHRQRVNEDINVTVEGIHSKELATDATQQSLGIIGDMRAGDWTLKGGVRHIIQNNSADDDSFNTVILGAKRGLDFVGRKGNIFGEYEQDLGMSSRKRIALGGDIQVHDNVKLYGRAERINSLTGISGLSSSQEQDTLSVGVKSDIMQNTEMYSEYRLRGATAGRDLETASGIRGTYQVEDGLSVSPRLEIINSMEGSGQDSIAASVGIKDTRDTSNRKMLRVETRHQSDRDYYGIEGSYVGRLDEEWSVLARDSLRIDNADGEDSKYTNTFSVGFARRPRTDNKHNMLFMYQNKMERGYDADGDCDTHILSTHQNYQIDEDTTISGRLGGKTEKCSAGGTTSTSDAIVLDGRYIWDITKRWDGDVHGGMLATDSMNEMQYSAGLGLSYLMKRNLRVSAGYNVKGFEDNDLDVEGYNKQGVYFGLQYKVDENSLGWLSGEQATDATNIDDAFKLDNAHQPKTIENNEEDKSLLDTVKNWFSGE